MKVKATVAKAIAGIALHTARAACGAASHYGTYQPKEPKNISSLKK